MKLFSKIFIITIILSSLGLYQLRGLGVMVRLLDIATILMIVMGLIVILIYGIPKTNIKSHFKTPIIFLLIGVFGSSISALAFHNQDIYLTLYQQRYMYAFLFYFLLIFMSPRPEWLIDVLFWFGVFSGMVYLTQYLLYPFLITDAKMFIDRGTLRMNLPGAYFMHIAFFLSIERYFTTHKKMYGFGAVLLFIVAVLAAFRSNLAMYVLITTGFVLLNQQIKHRILLFLLYAVLVVAGFFAFQEIFQEMIGSAEREASQGTSYVRFRAAEYLLSINDNHRITYITGNGEPTERSGYGMRMALTSASAGFYLSDIGIIGFYFKFGLISSLAIIFIIFKIIFAKFNQAASFIKLFFIFQLSLLFHSKTAFEFVDSIPAVCMLFYLFDFYRKDINENPVSF